MVVSELVVVDADDGKRVALAEESAPAGERARERGALRDALDRLEARVRATLPVDALPVGTRVGEVRVRADERTCRLRLYDVMQVTGRGVRRVPEPDVPTSVEAAAAPEEIEAAEPTAVADGGPQGPASARARPSARSATAESGAATASRTGAAAVDGVADAPATAEAPDADVDWSAVAVGLAALFASGR